MKKTISRVLLLASTAAFSTTGFGAPTTTETPIKIAVAPLLERNAAQEKFVNLGVISAVRVGDTLEITSYIPRMDFYFRAVPPVTPYDERVATKVLSLGQEFKSFHGAGWSLYKVQGFEEQGARITYESSFKVELSEEATPDTLSGNFLIRFKAPVVSESGLPDLYPLNQAQDKFVNDAVISAVRVDDKLEIQSETPSPLFWFSAVPASYERFWKPRPTRILSLGQELVLRDHHGTINYKVMEFQKDGLLIRYDSLFYLMSLGETTPRYSWGSFVVRFKAPATSTPAPEAK